jgi:hypothetical protein
MFTQLCTPRNWHTTVWAISTKKYWSMFSLLNFYLPRRLERPWNFLNSLYYNNPPLLQTEMEEMCQRAYDSGKLDTWRNTTNGIASYTL